MESGSLAEESLESKIALDSRARRGQGHCPYFFHTHLFVAPPWRDKLLP